ncbi:MAG: nuclear transport factor 2 family protein [Pyrinomonadaceae bacterium]|nr:nuclear transport factor 2 family protein [Pyrinomonadaceae bacterium]
MKILSLLFLIFMTMAVPVVVPAQSSDEPQSVKEAVLDYVEGVYEVSPARIERSIHPDLAKRGFFIKKGEKAYSPHTMTFAQLVELSKNYNKDGHVPKDAPKDVVVYDVSDQTASAKLTAMWGIDYMHLAKYEGKWKIINVLWQTPAKLAKAVEPSN